MTHPRHTTRYTSALAFALLLALVLTGCMTYGGTRRAYMERMTEYLPEPTRPVIVIPGFGNSRLYDPVDEKLVWGLGKNLVHTKYTDDLDLPVDPASGDFILDRLVPDGSFAGSRAPFNIAFTLSHALQQFGHYPDAGAETGSAGAVHTFAYDWRLSATTNARRLGELIDAIRAPWQPDPPRVDLVAHSAGGMIALAYVKLGGLGPEADADQIEAAAALAASKVASVTLIGVPQYGTNEAVRALARGEKLIRRDLSPVMMASFPSLTEMLPADGAVFIDMNGDPMALDVWNASTWERLGFAMWARETTPEMRHAFERSLERARRVRELLERPMPAGVRETVIASDCIPTAHRVLLRPDRSLAFYASELREGEDFLRQLMFVPGDGSIESRSALAGGRSEYVFCAGHHGMASDPNVHRALLRTLLEEGRESRNPGREAARRTDTSSMETPNPR